MKYLCFLFLLISAFSCGQKKVRLPQSIVLIQKEEMSDKYFISRYFEYDNRNRLISWTDSTYNENAGGIVVNKELMIYDDEGSIVSIVSLKNGQQSFQRNIIYEGNTIKIKVPNEFDENNKYSIPTVIELNNKGNASLFISNMYNRPSKTTFEYDEQDNLKIVTDDSYKKVYEYGNNKGCFHDIAMPSWFWVLTERTLQGIQLYNNDVQSITTTLYSSYSKSRTSTRKVSMEFDEDGYPILLKGIITNGFILKVNYY